MITKPYVIIRILTAFLFAFLIYNSGIIYPQGVKTDPQITTRPKLAVGQWVLYEINISKHSPSPRSASPKAFGGTIGSPPTDVGGQSRSYLFKISLVGEEQIEGESYFWEEVSLVSEGMAVKSLKKSISDDKPRKVIFKRDGFPALEIDSADIEHKLNIDISNIVPDIVMPNRDGNSKGTILVSRPDVTSGRGSPKATAEKVKYIVPANSEKIMCQELTYDDKGKSRQIISLVSDDIPVTGLAQSTCVGKDSIITIKLVNFGNYGAKSVMDGKVLKFGEIYKQE